MIVVFMTSIFLSIYCFSTEHGFDAIIDPEETHNWENGWILDHDEEISFPLRIHERENVSYTISNVLPDSLKKESAIMLPSHHAMIEVFIQGVKIFECSNRESIPFGKMTGNVICIVPLNNSYCGKTLEIKVTPYYNFTYEYQSILFGNRHVLAQHYIQMNFWCIPAILLFILIAITIFMLIIHHSLSYWTKEYHILIYFTVFEISIAVWLFLHSGLLQFLSNQTTAACFAYYIFLILIPCLYSGICRFLFMKYEKIFSTLEIGGYLLITFLSVTYACDVTDPISMRYIIHIYILIHIIVSLTIYSHYIHTDTLIKHIFAGSVLMETLCFISLISYHVHPGNKFEGKLLAIAGFIYSLNLLYLLQKIDINNTKALLEANAYKELAFTDPLTNIPNRKYFVKTLSDFRNSLSENDFVTFIMCDLNYLKITNDTYGHEAGDQLIIAAATCIQKVSEGIATCCRLGGDEFCIIFIDKNSSSHKKILDRLHREITIYNKSHKQTISMSIGYETQTFQKDENFFHNLYKKADQNMYLEKQKQHQK